MKKNSCLRTLVLSFHMKERTKWKDFHSILRNNLKFQKDNWVYCIEIKEPLILRQKAYPFQIIKIGIKKAMSLSHMIKLVVVLVGPSLRLQLSKVLHLSQGMMIKSPSIQFSNWLTVMMTIMLAEVAGCMRDLSTSVNLVFSKKMIINPFLTLITLAELLTVNFSKQPILRTSDTRSMTEEPMLS